MAIWASVTAAGGEAAPPQAAIDDIDDMLTRASVQRDRVETELRRALGVR